VRCKRRTRRKPAATAPGYGLNTGVTNPLQGHLGRQVKVWPDPVIFREVIVPWLARTLRVDGSEAGRER
jgi:hypothetical protein